MFKELFFAGSWRDGLVGGAVGMDYSRLGGLAGHYRSADVVMKRQGLTSTNISSYHGVVLGRERIASAGQLGAGSIQALRAARLDPVEA